MGSDSRKPIKGIASSTKLAVGACQQLCWATDLPSMDMSYNQTTLVILFFFQALVQFLEPPAVYKRVQTCFFKTEAKISIWLITIITSSLIFLQITIWWCPNEFLVGYAFIGCHDICSIFEWKIFPKIVHFQTKNFNQKCKKSAIKICINKYSRLLLCSLFQHLVFLICISQKCFHWMVALLMK